MSILKQHYQCENHLHNANINIRSVSKGPKKGLERAVVANRAFCEEIQESLEKKEAEPEAEEE